MKLTGYLLLQWKAKIVGWIIVLLTILCFVPRLQAAQKEHPSDSLWRALQQAPRDTAYIDKLNALTDQYIMSGAQDPLPLAKEALRIADSLGYARGRAISTLNLAIVLDIQANYQQALQYYLRALTLIGQQADLESYEAQAYMNLGYFYSAQYDFSKAIHYTQLAAEIQQRLYGDYGAAFPWGNLGDFFIRAGQYDSARYYTRKSLEGYQIHHDSSGLGDVYHNLARIALFADGDKQKALELSLQALSFYEASPNSEVEASTEALLTVGMVYLQLNRLNLANYYLSKAANIAREKKLMRVLLYALIHQTQLLAREEHWQEAYMIQKEAFALHDSINSLRSMFTLEQMQAQLDLETKEAHIALLNKDKLLQEDELARQTLLRNGFIGLFGLLLMVALMLYRNKEEKRRNNKMLSSQMTELEEKSEAILRQNRQMQEQRRALLSQSENLQRAHQQILRQKEIIERKNQDTTDSLHYARRIQTAMLPKTAQLGDLLPDSFVWLQPRDIVSGDFSWSASHKGKVFIAAVDCTGHGVPGAFVSLIAGMYLNQIVLQEEESSACSILRKLNAYIHQVLSREDGNMYDGLEIALCVLDEERKVLEFSGARGLLYCVEGGEISKVKGNRLTLGVGEIADSEIECHYLPYRPGQAYYMCTDGLRDQFGGPQDKKFGERRLFALLKSVADLPASVQAERIRETLEHWMEGQEQTDDILILGWKVGEE